MKVITDYRYNAIDYDYIASGNDDYDYLSSCNRLQLIMVTPCLVYSSTVWQVIEHNNVVNQLPWYYSEEFILYEEMLAFVSMLEQCRTFSVCAFSQRTF